MYTGFWTPWNEHWYQSRLKGILYEDQGTRNSQEWKRLLQQFDDAKKIGSALGKGSENFIDQYLLQQSR